ncbi:unnamed protein product [Thlaspi arvense]|uniref:Uncharacterized protein n=1 Tax=Thlaspi arvense TaxID=13288 RepID=A0AAU9T4J2_THLAR|nr:unnamed protein product [Thlaspi arvense]
MNQSNVILESSCKQVREVKHITKLLKFGFIGVPNKRQDLDSPSHHSSHSTLSSSQSSLSLSLVLRHYLPLAGRLTWDPQDPKPCIVVSKDETVSLTIAETNADFSVASGDGLRPAAELDPLVPELTVVSDGSATVLSLQITLFQNQGFCIGITFHHAVLDGTTSTMFLKSWAHICSLQEHNKAMEISLLPDDLTPRFDRTVINVPSALEAEMMELLLYLSKDIGNLRSLKPPPKSETGGDIIPATFELTAENTEKLREQVKARGGNGDRPVRFLYVADFRNRLEPQVPAGYFGNCVFPIGWFEYKATTFLEENGFVNAVEILSDSVKGLGSLGIESLCKDYIDRMKKMKPDVQFITVTGSTRLGVYMLDFGWGRPAKTEALAIEAFSMSERRDE